MSGGGEASGVTGVQSVVVSGRPGLGEDADGVLGCRMGGGGGVYGWDGDGERQIIRWEDTVANIIVGTDPNAPLAYAPGLDLQH